MGIPVTRLAGALAAAALMLAACAAPPDNSALDAERARAVAELEQQAALTRPGTRVCRRVPVGISERDWLHGTVVEVSADRIAVHIDGAGRFPNQLEGVPVAAGTIAWTPAIGWIPCY